MRTILANSIAGCCILFSLSIGGFQARVQSKPPVDKPIQFLDHKTIQGAESIVVPGATILIGEVHGTWEIPVLVATLVRQAAIEDIEIILCLEFSSSEQASLDRFLSSDGGAEAKNTLLKQQHWTNQDGRASVGMFAMLELVRRLRSEGKRIQIVTMDSNWILPEEDFASLSPEKLRQLEELASKRDGEMAKAVIQARGKSTDAIIIAYAGNVHTRITKGTDWDPDYIPMGWYVSEKVKNLISLDVDHANGQAWVTTERGSGQTNFAGKDRGPIPFVELFGNADSGYHGKLYVGRITAAKPASMK